MKPGTEKGHKVVRGIRQSAIGLVQRDVIQIEDAVSCGVCVSEQVQ